MPVDRDEALKRSERERLGTSRLGVHGDHLVVQTERVLRWQLLRQRVANLRLPGRACPPAGHWQ